MQLPQNDTPDLFEQEINIQELLQVLWVQKHIIAMVTALVLSAVLFYHFTATPEYLPRSVVLIKSEKSLSPAGIDPLSSFVGGLKNDIELMKSFPLAEDVVRKLYSDPGRPKLELFGERRYVSPIGELFSWGHGAGGGSGVLDGDLMMRAYARSLQGRITIENARDTDILNISVSSPFPEEAALLTNTLAAVYMRKDIEWNADQTRLIKDFVGEQLETQKREIGDLDRRLADYMQREDIYELTGNAQNLLNKLIEAESRHNDAQSEYNILKKRQSFLAEKLSEDEKAFSARVARNIDRQTRELKNRIRQEEMALIGTEKRPVGQEAAARQQQLELLKQRVVDITRISIAGELAYSTKARQFQFDLISEQLQIDVRLAELSYIAEEFRRVRDDYNAQLGQLPRKQLDFARLQRDRDVLNNTYTFLKGKFEESRIKIASELGKVVIVGAAYPPTAPVAPNLKKNLLIGLILGLGLGGALVFVREMLDHSLKDPAFLEAHGYITLAAIPYVQDPGQNTLQSSFRSIARGISSFRKMAGGIFSMLPKPLRRGGATDATSSGPYGYGRRRTTSSGKALPEIDREKPPLLITDSLSSSLAESFRDLRTNITFSLADRQLRSLLVTGTEVSEGKSTVCANLAIAFALIGRRVLVIDCDLRRPSQQKKFNLKKNRGLSDYLAGVKDDVHALIQPTTQHKNLFVLSSGSKTPNPNELLGSQKMTDLVKQLEGEWDLVMIDSPPILLLSDAALISRAADAILMVVRVGYTDKNLLKEVQKLDYIKKGLLGTAVIGPSESTGTRGYGRYYSRYGYGYKSYSRYLDEDGGPPET